MFRKLGLKLVSCLGVAAVLAGCGGTFQVGILPPTESVTPFTSTSPALAQSTPAETASVPTQPNATAEQPNVATLTPSATSNQPALQQSSTATATPCKPPAQWASYSVKAGDTLFVLSQQTNVTVQQLRDANCLVTDVIRTGQQIYLPYVPTATFTPTLTPTPTPPLPTVDPSAIWAPNGKRYATNAGVVVDVEQRLVASDLLIPDALSVWRWTSDSRYVIFGRKNQFNSTYTYVFDTQTWKLVFSTNGCSVQANSGSLTDACSDYPFTMSPTANRFVMENGIVVDLATLQTTDLLANLRPTQLTLYMGSWSPDGTYFVWVTSDSALTKFAFYLAEGTGQQGHLLATLTGTPTDLRWTANNTVLLITTQNSLILDASTGTINTIPIITVTPSATISPTP